MSDELKLAHKFASENLSSLSKEILKWHNSGVLEDGLLRQMAEPLKTLDQYHYLTLAENIVNTEALKHCSKL